MTAAVERVSRYYAPELPPPPSRFARAINTFNETRTVVKELVAEFREIPQSISSRGVIFSPERTTEQRTESESRFYQGLAEKKKLLAVGDPRHEEIKTALVIGGGAHKGISSAAMLEGFRDNNVVDAFDDIFTESAATANIAFLLGSENIGSDMYIKLAQDGFMKRKPHGMRLEMLANLIQRNVDPQKIRGARPNWFIGVTDDFGQKRQYEARTLSDNDLLRVICTSMAAPWAFNRHIRYQGERLTDGYLTGLSTDAALKRKNTHIAVMLNETDDEIALAGTKIPLKEKIALPPAMWGVYSWDVIRATLNRGKALQETLRLLDDYPDVDVARLTAAHDIDWQTNDILELEKARTSAREKCEAILDRNGLLVTRRTLN